MHWRALLVSAVLLGVGIVSVLGQPAPAPETAPALRPFRVASDYPSIQAAIDSLPEGTGGTVYIPEGRWVLDKPLDLTRRTYYRPPPEIMEAGGFAPRTSGYLHLMGAGHGTILEGRMKEGPVIDMVDSSYCTLSNMQIQSQTAQCGILLGRPHQKNRGGILVSSGWHTFYNLWINGSYSVACVYNQASEVDRWYGCTFMNSHPDAYCFVFTYRNFAGIVSPYAGEMVEIGSNADQRLHGCLFMQHPPAKENPEGACIYIQGWAEDFALTDCDFGVGGVKALLWLDGTRSPVKEVHLMNNRFENSATYLLLATGRSIHTQFVGNTCYGAKQNLVRAESADSWVISDNQLINYEGKDLPALVFGSLINSSVTRNWIIISESEEKKGQTPLMVVEGGCVGCDLTLARRADFQGTLTRSRLTALDEEGVRREYLGSAAGSLLLNLPPVDTSKIASPKRGDVALDDGTNTQSGKPGLAVYDGERWQYMN